MEKIPGKRKRKSVLTVKLEDRRWEDGVDCRRCSVAAERCVAVVFGQREWRVS